MNKIILFCFSLLSFSAVASPKYKVSDIPKSMLAEAKAVIRNSEVNLEIISSSRAVFEETYAITILNRNGLDLSKFVELYDKFISVRNIKITLYDQNGNVVRAGIKKEPDDVAAFSGYSLYEDNRAKILDPGYAAVPFTVEYSYSLSFDGYFSLPSWKPYGDYNISVEKASFSLTTPLNHDVRFFEKNIKTKYTKLIGEGKITLTWKIESQPALKKEAFSPPINSYLPVVYVAPSDFEIDGFEGNCDSWTNFGLWIRKLCDDRGNLDEATKTRIRSLVENVTSDSAKVRILYNYMQNKVRYVSIQIGIGGWRPIKAESVDKVSYGDCKALSNYMKALLETAGIKSYYTLAMAGEDAGFLESDFPSSQFNHAILCVPLGSDTTWLECTSQRIPYGFLGTFTDNRKVLLINDNGGVVVKTTRYLMNSNTQTRRADIKLSGDGSASCTMLTDYNGLIYDELSRILRMDDFDRKKSIIERTYLSNVDLKSFAYREVKSKIPLLAEKLVFDVRDYCSATGNQLIFKPNIISRLNDVPVRSFARISPVFIRRGYNETDTLTYTIPFKFNSGSEPLEYALNSPFGEYKYTIKFSQSKLVYTRSFTLFEGTYPPEKYNDLVDFLESVRSEDNRQLIFKQ